MNFLSEHVLFFGSIIFSVECTDQVGQRERCEVKEKKGDLVLQLSIMLQTKLPVSESVTEGGM